VAAEFYRGNTQTDGRTDRYKFANGPLQQFCGSSYNLK